jgi:hypothetical protein
MVVMVQTLAGSVAHPGTPGWQFNMLFRSRERGCGAVGEVKQYVSVI